MEAKGGAAVNRATFKGNEMPLCNDAAEQLAHETRLREDIDYAVKCRTETIFSDLNEFEAFMYDGYEAGRLIIREWLRALYIQRYSKAVTYSDKCTDAVYAFDALSNCNDALDAKIRQIIEGER